MKVLNQLYLMGILILFITRADAQWQTNNQLSDLNSWSAQPGYFGWYNTGNNTPASQGYGTGMQMSLPSDGRYGSQIALPTFDNQIYYRNNRNGVWEPWYKVWSTANFDPDTYLDMSVSNIRNSGLASSFANGYTFSYATAGTPWNGSLISYGGYGGAYDTQISSDYGPNGGKHISFRTRNGDAQVWNNWYEIYNSGNLNNSEIDFAAKTINCANIYAGGNLWAKEVKVAIANPWGDYVFSRHYRLPSLEKVEKYVNENHHLPEIPSAKEIALNGIDVGEMNRILVKKVEELTLYLIDLKKENKDLGKRLTKLERKSH